MNHRHMLSVLLITVAFFSCKKEKETTVPPQITVPEVLLKEINVPNLPPPQYHFDYTADGKISKVLFSSGIRMYDLVYNGTKISEMKNNTAVNKDRLQYTTDELGRATNIIYVDEGGTTFRRCFLTYDGTHLQKMEWGLKDLAGFVTDRTLTFTYFADGNLQQMIDHRLPVAGQTETTLIRSYDLYDNKINADGFSLAHAESDHLLLLPGVQLQKNNPRKETLGGTALNYNIDYTYTYNDKNVPLSKIGDVVITNGPNAGQRFPTSALFTYY
jgi:hypothetical protein